MPRITTHYSAAGAKAYYSATDYYASGPEQLQGHWVSRGIEELGVRAGSVVDPLHFERLIDRIHPLEGHSLALRQRDGRRYGYDVTFSAPKSVSIAWAIFQDHRILEALEASIVETAVELEQDIRTRVNTSRGKLHTERTGNAPMALWIHTTSRDTPGQVADPQLHGHLFIANLTRAGDRFTAADISSIYRDSGYYDALFQSRLATKVQAIGYAVERSRDNFELRGVSRALIEKFSKRSVQVQATAQAIMEKHGLSRLSAETLGKLGATSRQSKTPSVSPEQLPDLWRQQLTLEERIALEKVRAQDFPPRPPQVTARVAVDYAVQHQFEREAVVRERSLLRDALLQGIGDNTVAAIRQEVCQRPWIRSGAEESAWLTTRELQQEEIQVLAFARGGRGRVKPLNTEHVIERDWLSGQQQAVVQGLLRSSDRVQICCGAAGVGKTTVMRETIDAIESTGKRVAVLAPGTKAAYDVLQGQEGFDATTIAAFLQDTQRQCQIRQGVLWIDEAGLVGTTTMLALFDIARQQNARVILGGDRFQHAPIERGTPLKLLETQAGIKPHELTEIRRQQGDYKKAIQYLSRGEVEQGLAALESLGFVHEIADPNRNQVLAKAYADAVEKHGPKEVLVIAPTHAERHEIAIAIRRELRQRRQLIASRREKTASGRKSARRKQSSFDDKEVELTVLASRQLSKAQRSDPLNYRPGDVVAFHAKAKGGIQPGTYLHVAHVTRDKVISDDQREIPLGSAGAFDVFAPEKERFSVGDTIRITRKRREGPGAKRLNNGSVYTIASITGRRPVLTLDNGEKIDPATWAHFTHGAVVTSYVSQGMTVQHCLVAQSSLSFPASSPEQAYVSASRAKQRVDIFTDDLDGLRQAVARSRPRQSALDLKPNIDDRISPRRWRVTFDRIRSVAQQFATRQLERFHDWWPQPHAQPEMRI